MTRCQMPSFVPASLLRADPQYVSLNATVFWWRVSHPGTGWLRDSVTTTCYIMDCPSPWENNGERSMMQQRLLNTSFWSSVPAGGILVDCSVSPEPVVNDALSLPSFVPCWFPLRADPQCQKRIRSSDRGSTSRGLAHLLTFRAEVSLTYVHMKAIILTVANESWFVGRDPYCPSLPPVPSSWGHFVSFSFCTAWVFDWLSTVGRKN